MSEEQDERPSQISATALEAFLSDAPWKAKSFLAAGATTIAGLGAWLNDMMSPVLARGGASYLGGFLIGWAFRRTLKIAALIAGSLLALITLLKTIGWIHLDWSLIEADGSRSLAWIQGKAEGFREVLTGYLPSAGAGGAGVYFGFRKK